MSAIEVYFKEVLSRMTPTLSIVNVKGVIFYLTYTLTNEPVIFLSMLAEDPRLSGHRQRPILLMAQNTV